MYLLADQTGTDLDAAVIATAESLHRRGQAAQAATESDWPFEG